MTIESTVLLDEFNRHYLPLCALQSRLSQAITESDRYPLWTFSGGREELAEFVTLLEYDDDQAAGGSTTHFPAVAGLPRAACELIPEINQHRADLAAFFRDLGRETTAEGVLCSKYVLGKAQLRRLNRNALARQYRVLTAKPSSIRYLWATNRSIQKMTVAQAVEVAARKIIKASDQAQREALLAEQAKLYALPSDEIVARVYIDRPQPRVNMVVDGLAVKSSVAILPLFYPDRAGAALPELIPLPPSKEDRARLGRADRIVDEQAFAPLIKIHRYLE